MMNLYIDTETTGIPKKGSDWRTDYNEFPYILSVAIKTEIVPGTLFEWHIKENMKYVTEESQKINGIGIEHHGEPEKEVLNQVIRWCSVAETITGHNLYFDSSIIKANVLRYFGPDSEEAKLIEEALHKDKRIDTVRLAQKKYGGKYISLSDLYFKLFGERFNAHNALEDVIAVERVYNALI